MSAREHFLVGLLGLIVAIGCGGQATGTSGPAPCGDDCGPGACEIRSQLYDSGTTGIPAGDGCNTCSCADGVASCTEIDCTANGESCEVNGVIHAHGASFPAPDGCNTCACDDGRVACTLIACATGCNHHGECAATEVCVFPTGTCGGSGSCVPMPSSCDTIYQPVCGCDGRTYGNSCEARSNGVSVATAGECASPACGPCAAGEYCAAPEGQCTLTNATCTGKPDACEDVLAPVCGCNGVTYSNACEAASLGINVRSTGACPVECWDHTACGVNEYCAEETGMCFLSYPAASSAELPAPPPDGDADPASGSGAARPAPTGMCAARPTECGEIFAPVCGCDYVTYDNPCAAAAVGVSLLQEGPCP